MGTTMSPIKPFENEEESLSIGDLTAENRTDRVELYGRIHLTRDKSGLEMARQLKALIDSEDKKNPYSDEKIKDELYKMGIPCARRTVAKYRKLLKIAPASQRKHWGA